MHIRIEKRKERFFKSFLPYTSLPRHTVKRLDPITEIAKRNWNSKSVERPSCSEVVAGNSREVGDIY